MTRRVGWKSVLIKPGAQSAMIVGTYLMPLLPADNLGSLQVRSFHFLVSYTVQTTVCMRLF